MSDNSHEESVEIEIQSQNDESLEDSVDDESDGDLSDDAADSDDDVVDFDVKDEHYRQTLTEGNAIYNKESGRKSNTNVKPYVSKKKQPKYSPPKPKKKVLSPPGSNLNRTSYNDAQKNNNQTHNMSSFRKMYLSELSGNNLVSQYQVGPDGQTVFSKVSLEVLEKYRGNYDTKFKSFTKEMAYNMLINENYHKRVTEKNDKDEIQFKYNDFIERNKQMQEKKKERLRDKKEERDRIVTMTCPGVPSTNVRKDEKTRNIKEFFQDNIKYKDDVTKRVEEERAKKAEEQVKAVQNKPKINKKSDKLAKEKNEFVSGQNMFNRLHRETIHNEPKHFVNTEKADAKRLLDHKNKKEFNVIKEAQETKLNEKKTHHQPTKTEKDGLHEKLHREATVRKLKQKNKALEHDKKEDLENHQGHPIIPDSTNLRIFEKFIKDFELGLSSLFNRPRECMLTFEEFAQLMHALGFIKLQYDSKQIAEDEKKEDEAKKRSAGVKPKSAGTMLKPELEPKLEPENPEVKIQRFRRRNEHICLKDAWKILTSGNSDMDKIDSNQLIVFCASILGVYQGNDPNALKEEIKPFQLKTTESEVSLKSNRSQPKSPKKPPTSPKRNVPTSPKTLRLSPDRNNKSTAGLLRNETELSNKTNLNVTRTLIRVILPDFNLQKYSYFPKTVDHIHSIFHQLYNNRVGFLIEAKKQEELQKSIKAEILGADTDPFKFKFQLDKKTNENAMNYRKKCYTTAYQSFDNIQEKKQENIKIDQVYNILQQKKEIELGKMRVKQEKEELKDCTFQPNLKTKYKKKEVKCPKEDIKKLYEDADRRNKERVKDYEENIKVRETKEQEGCVFNPKLNPTLNYTMFEVDPLIQDKQVKKKIEKCEKYRMQKKVINVTREKGIHYLNKFSNIDDLLSHEENLKPLVCSNEYLGYKDAISTQINKGMTVTKSKQNNEETIRPRNTVEEVANPKRTNELQKISEREKSAESEKAAISPLSPLSTKI